MSLKRLALMLMIPLSALSLSACGSILGNADGAAKLIISRVYMTDNISGEDESTRLLFFPMEAVYDTGCDQVYGNNSLDGENDNFPQPCEQIVEAYPLSDDKIFIEVMNEPRLGVKDPIDLIVNKVTFTYYDRDLDKHNFMPKNVVDLTQRVAADETVAFDVMAVPVKYKTAVGGLREIFLYGSPAEIDKVSTWTVYIDVDAMDPENGDTVHAQAVETFNFTNPIPYKGKKSP